MRFETNRLILRAPKDRDINDLIDGLNNLNVSQYLAMVPYPYEEKDALWWISHCNKKLRKKNKDGYEFSIELKSEKKIIGGCCLSKIDLFNETAEVGCWLNEKYWRRGVMTEAMDTVISFAFKDLKLNRLGWYAYVPNIASNAIAQKLGFVFEGTLKKYHKAKSTGKIYDTNVYGLLRENYKK